MAITRDRIDADAIVATGVSSSSGAQVVFKGIVRDHNDGRRVRGLHYDCYDEMAEREINRIVSEVSEACDVGDITIIHRVGDLAVGETSLLVVVEAPHRRAAFEAAMQVVDEIKQRVPIWKKEKYDDEREQWL